jgi:putative ATPase
MPGLFDDQAPAALRIEKVPSSAPLAERMRPATLDEVVGHRELLGPGGFLRRAIGADRVPSLILWGPPGSGKTTLARLIAATTGSEFVPFSAVTSGIKEVKEVMASAAKMRQVHGRRTLVFVDEIHRFNRAQQDAFLPYVERGDIVLVGATTENPSFELNAALLSRLRVVVLSALPAEDLRQLLERALGDRERGLGSASAGIAVDPAALDAIVQLSSGDARKALNLLELAVADARDPDAQLRLDAERVRQVAQKKILLYDKSGEEHFNLISALHKSLRESDADAALYWLTRMLAAGEDPLYVARRMVRFASEDIGLADPQALVQALAARESYHLLGSPEGELALAQAVVYMALAPKSTAIYAAYGATQKTIEERPADPVPLVIRNAVTSLMGNVGYGRGYVYAPSTAEGMGGLECLPDALAGTRFYEPRGRGFEAKLLERMESLRAQRMKLQSTPEHSTPAKPQKS